MEKRVFLAIFLSFIVLTVFQLYLSPAKPAPGTANSSTSSSGDAAAPTPSLSPSTMVPAVMSPAAGSSASAAASRPTVADTTAHDIVVDTDTVRAVFSSRGGVLESWRLKKYADSEGNSLDLVPNELPEQYARPFTLATDDQSLTTTLATALYQPSATNLSLGASPGTLSFEYRDASGLTARKTFYFQPDNHAYLVRLDASIEVGGAARPVIIEWGPALGLGYSEEGSRYAVPAAAVQFRDGATERLSASDLTKQPRYQGAMKFAGVGDQYFLSAVLPDSNTVQLEYLPLTMPIPRDPKARTRTFVSYTVRTPAAASLAFFIGPKDFDILHALNVDFVHAINFGMFSLLVVPMRLALKWINGFVHNFGLSIIALTALINLAIFPLRHRSMVSMKKMQALQPQVKSIQDRAAKFKITDPERQKVQNEDMALYKEKGVNPASGCLPMLLTMPILFAFYAMLAAAIELRGAPFYGWLHDLSRHDPLYITPVLMGLTMFWQQRSMPSTADPMQQKMFLILPIVFTVGFLWAPAGLVLYWLSSNLMAIGQQTITNRMIAAPVAIRPASTASERRSEARGRREQRRVRIMTVNLDAQVVEFVLNVTKAMGLSLDAATDESVDHVRINLSGAGADVLVKRNGEPLDALQVIVNTVFRRDARGDRHYVIDAMAFRKDKDGELRQTARQLMEKAKTTGVPQSIGPLNPYARRLVHLEVAEDPATSSESVGDAFLKSVIISRKA